MKKLINTDKAEGTKVAATFRNMQKSQDGIRQLCSMVNHYSNQLGLGNKVRVEDFLEAGDEARNALVVLGNT